MDLAEAYKVYARYAAIIESVAWLRFELIRTMGIDNYKDNGTNIHVCKVLSAVDVLGAEISEELDKGFEDARKREEENKEKRDVT